MAFGTNPEDIFSANIWLTGFHCITTLSFPLMLVNFLFVTSSPSQGRLCISHIFAAVWDFYQSQTHLVYSQVNFLGAELRFIS